MAAYNEVMYSAYHQGKARITPKFLPKNVAWTGTSLRNGTRWYSMTGSYLFCDWLPARNVKEAQTSKPSTTLIYSFWCNYTRRSLLRQDLTTSTIYISTQVQLSESLQYLGSLLSPPIQRWFRKAPTCSVEQMLPGRWRKSIHISLHAISLLTRTCQVWG